VVSQLETLEKEYPNFYFLDLANTHEKVLIKDSEYVITTSFNWLSFRGDPKRTLRYERGVYIAIPELVDEQFEVLAKRFEGAKQLTPSAAQLDALKSKFSR
jgi:phosphatidylserine/phosphatidylglycerophosphate/cardiolipin synthase-like enzyme